MADQQFRASDADVAARAALEAGHLLLSIRDPAGLGPSTESADDRSDRLIAEQLKTARPADAILSEEIASRGDRLHAERVWIVDPLDGTREYGEADRPDWAVHVALWQRGELVAGAFAVPALDELWSSEDTSGAPSPDRPVKRIAVSRTRPPAWALAVAAELAAEVVPMGSAGAKVAAVLRGDVDAYLHDGGQYEWDSAAPVVVARAHGYHASRADGSPLRYNQPDPYLPDLIVCPPSTAPDILARIARHRTQASGQPPTDK